MRSQIVCLPIFKRQRKKVRPALNINPPVIDHTPSVALVARMKRSGIRECNTQTNITKYPQAHPYFSTSTKHKTTGVPHILVTFALPHPVLRKASYGLLATHYNFLDIRH